MLSFYATYRWKKGIPYGTELASPHTIDSYKIISDPYYKRLTIEKYRQGAFLEVVFDSHFIDFRHLNERNQKAWGRQTIEETTTTTTCLIRDMDDRILFLEKHHFKNGRCLSCEIFTPQGWLLAINQMFYQEWGDAFNGVILYDRERIPVMKKSYSLTPEHEFHEVLEENWHI